MILSTKLAPHFTLEEFLRSDVAWCYGDLRSAQIKAADDVEIVTNLTKVALVLEYVRGLFDAPIYINSGYRSKALNDFLREIGYSSHPQSKHLLGRAADIRGTNIKETRKLWNILIKHKSVDVLHSYCKSTSKSTYIHFQLLPDV